MRFNLLPQTADFNSTFNIRVSASVVNLNATRKLLKKNNCQNKLQKKNNNTNGNKENCHSKNKKVTIERGTSALKPEWELHSDRHLNLTTCPGLPVPVYYNADTPT